MNNDIKLEFYFFENYYFDCRTFEDNNFYELLDNTDVRVFLISFLEKNPFFDENLDKKFKKNFDELSYLLKKKN